jgi:hypothetical protein
MRARLPLPLPLLAAALALLGCGATPDAGPDGAGIEGEPGGAESGLASGLVQIDPRTGGEAGARFLELDLANRSDGRRSGRCAAEWFDARGEPLGPPSGWASFDLDRGERQRLRLAPMPPEARSWRLRFRG